MELQSDLIGETAIDVVQSSCLNSFERIHDENVYGVVWNREIPSKVSSLLEMTEFNHPTSARFFVPISKISERAAQALEVFGLPKCPAQAWLANDIQMLATKLGAILSASKLQVRVELVDTDACKKFHRDNVKARLVCTYKGPGTVYGVARIGAEPDQINQADTGHPVLLKGRLWSKGAETYLLHRSPRIESAGLSRIVVVMDEVLNEYQTEL
ncbi:DUF1826 domain-containing protein [Litorimonas haliclonae]|uniref:DUF1826 domain-containing protein n=1 Tax=Litorimonas haliclonae TaxID=2081977 RepID=UPI0039F01F70